MDILEQKLVEVLTQYISPITVQGIIRRCREKNLIGNRPLTEADLPLLIRSMDISIRLFLPEEKRDALRRELQKISGQKPILHPQRVSIRVEMDIVRARNEARQVCEQLGARSFTTQKVATAVSELARNIVSYTPGGFIELIPHAGTPSRIVVRAVDEGKGIANLEEILSGRYKSRTGLGMGLRGVKQLVDRMDIQTGPEGTRIEFEVAI